MIFRQQLWLAAAFLATVLVRTEGFSASTGSTPKNPVQITKEVASPKKDFVKEQFLSTDIDDGNIPPSLSIILRQLQQLTSQGSDIRGRFVDHVRVGPMAKACHAIGRDEMSYAGTIPSLTPLACFFLGHAFAKQVLREQQSSSAEEAITIAIGRDPRPHGLCLCDAFGRGALSADPRIRVVYTGLATTPAMFHFCRAGLCHGAAMVTASHLPVDRNGLKLFTAQGGFTKQKLADMRQSAMEFARKWHDREGMVPPTSGGEGVFCSQWVEFMPDYADTLKNAILNEVKGSSKPLEGLKIVLNVGHGSGGFFNKVLEDLGADVSASLHVEPNGEFPAGVPNPEYKQMIETTTNKCQQVGADLGILLDTDADRSGFVVPQTADGGSVTYQPLNRNRLIALLSVIFSRSSPGCAIVTDSVTSEGLAKFIEQDLSLQHVRYLKGYANVIGKAQELTESGAANAEMAIETSGHCAMQENGYLDDGTYTAVKVIGLLAREKQDPNSTIKSVLDLIKNLEEMAVEAELRMPLSDGSLESTSKIFDIATAEITKLCLDPKNNLPWTLDTDNLEGIRVRTGNGGFFMLRKSLHDPLISLQVEAASKEEAVKHVIQPLVEQFESQKQIRCQLDMSALKGYSEE